MSHVRRFDARDEQNPGGALYRAFTIRYLPPEDGAEPDAPIPIAISSEAPVLRYDWWEREAYYEVLDHSPGGVDLSYVRDGIPICIDHALRQQIGIGEPVTLDDDRTLRTLIYEGNHPDAAWAIADMRGSKGGRVIRKKISVGYDPGETYTQTKTVGSEIPTRTYRGWMPFEASTVVVPADYEVGVGRDARGIAGRSPASLDAAKSARTPEEPVMADDEKEVAARNAATEVTAQRYNALIALATTHSRLSDLKAWVDSGRSVEQIKDTLLDDITAREKEKAPIATVGNTVTGMRDRAEDKPWETGEFFRCVVKAGQTPESMDVRLRAQRAGSGANITVNSEGGFAVPGGETAMLFETMYKSGELLSRVTRRPISVGNTYSERRLKETSRAAGSRFGGLTVAWTGEGNTITASKPELREVSLTLRKLTAAAYLTEEQVADGPALQSFINEAIPEAMRFEVERCIWAGLGAGQPLGILNGGGAASVAIETAQTIANTAGNIWVNAAKMFAAMPTSMLNGACYFINQELWSKILTATAGTGASAPPMFTPPGTLSTLPNGGIYGKPIVPIEYASAEGTVGDFVFANMSDYLMIDKGGFASSTSMHVRFLNDEQTIKFTYRVDGTPRTLTAMTPANGSQLQSAYVTLAARS